MKQLQVFACLIFAHSLSATTLVYNLKIRRVFSGLSMLLEKRDKALWIATAVPISYTRKTHFVNKRFLTDLHDKRSGFGSVFNLRYVPTPAWWLEATTAVQKETSKTTGTSTEYACRSAFDDVVISGGYNSFLSERTQLSWYGLAGFPTTTDVSLVERNERLVGTRFFAVGGGFEGSYSFIMSQQKTLVGILQLRAIHFFTREWETLFGPGSKIQPGQTIDLLLSLRYRYGFTSFEAGYNPTFFIHQALLLPTETIDTPTTVRQGGYANLMHLTSFTLNNHPVAVGTGFLVNTVKRLEARSFSWWVNVTIIF